MRRQDAKLAAKLVLKEIRLYISHLNLANFRKLRVGDYRVVYQVKGKTIVVYVLAVGPRRDREVYKAALKMK